MDDGWYRVAAFAGFLIVGFLAWVTGRRSSVNWKTIGGSFGLAWVLGGLTFWFPWSRQALSWLNDVLISLLNVYQKGNIFLFGPLAIGPGQTLPDGTASIGFVLAMQVLPAVIFFSAVVAGLYYLKIMPAIVRGFAWLFYRVMKISGAESLSASANIFVGIESSLTIRPYLARLTPSELLTVLTCMMATVASTVMAIYVIALHGVFPEIAGHLVSASIISIPCAILISKLTLPEDQQPETLGDLPATVEDSDASEHKKAPSNLIAALIEGGMQGVQMAVGIATLLIVFLGLEAMVDLVLGLLPQMGEASLSLNRILSWLAWPFTVLMGLKSDEWQTASQILGARFCGNGSGGLLPAGLGSGSRFARSFSPVFNRYDLRPVRIRSCGQYGNFCGRIVGADSFAYTGYFAVGVSGFVDGVPGHRADRLYCRGFGLIRD